MCTFRSLGGQNLHALAHITPATCCWGPWHPVRMIHIPLELVPKIFPHLIVAVPNADGLGKNLDPWLLFLHVLSRPRGTSSACLPSDPECMPASPSCCFSGSGNLHLFLDSSQCVLASSTPFSMLGLGPTSTWSSQSSEPLPFCCISLPPTVQAAKDACLVEVEGEMLPRNRWDAAWDCVDLGGMGLLGAPVTSHFLYWPKSQKFELQLVGVLYDTLWPPRPVGGCQFLWLPWFWRDLELSASSFRK